MKIKPIKVLSLFDGMSCGQLALQKAGIPVKVYYACEINKYAIKVTQHNFPKTIQLGDVRNVHAKDLPKVDLLIGGSPCQGFSNAGTGLNFEHPESKLFFEFVRIKNELTEINPNLKFLLENVQMKKEWENIISKYMGVNPIKINSALVSAQNRVRLYWNNFNLQKYGLFDTVHNVIAQPKDRKIFLKDILETEVDEKYFLSDKMLSWLNRHGEKRGIHPNIREQNGKSRSINVVNRKMNMETNYIVHNTQPRSGDPVCVAIRGRNPENPTSRKAGLPTEQTLEPNNTGKTNSLTTVQKDNLVKYNLPIQINPCLESGGKQPYQQNRVYSVNGKAPANQAQLTVGSYAIQTNSRIRRLTPIECCRLQTVPDNFFKDENGVNVISDSWIYECLGNGWTVDVIVHQFGYLKYHLSVKEIQSIRKSIKSIAKELNDKF